ncbi:hypothetical protein Pmani_033157 [Petrolisthes manimaculis]|uniref:Uncharacterized protein n=1 Tax=Petrolisthes manimaculis TaxID=1843537 RepID=A0AAE1NQ78_9EUCA|nr:hypothetical protein Pmani_033157 [Petrolisthes manimaculis]
MFTHSPHLTQTYSLTHLISPKHIHSLTSSHPNIFIDSPHLTQTYSLTHLIFLVVFPHLVGDHTNLLEYEVELSGAGGHTGVYQVGVVYRVTPMRHPDVPRRVVCVGGVSVWQRVRSEVVIDVQHVSQQRLRRSLLLFVVVGCGEKTDDR